MIDLHAWERTAIWTILCELVNVILKANGPVEILSNYWKSLIIFCDLRWKKGNIIWIYMSSKTSHVIAIILFFLHWLHCALLSHTCTYNFIFKPKSLTKPWLCVCVCEIKDISLRTRTEHITTDQPLLLF